MRPWAEASEPPLVRTTVSKVSVRAVVETSSCKGDSPLPLFAGASVALGACWFAGWPVAALRTANCGPASRRCLADALPTPAAAAFRGCRRRLLGEKRQSSTSCAKARKSGSTGCGAASPLMARSSTQDRNRCWPSASCRLSVAPWRASAGAETTRPVGRTKPSHSRWAAMDIDDLCGERSQVFFGCALRRLPERPVRCGQALRCFGDCWFGR